MLSKGSKVGIVACSNGYLISHEGKLKRLLDTLDQMGFVPILSNCIFTSEGVFNGTPSQKARELMSMFVNEEIEAIFDISGGNLANEVLEYLDYEMIRKHMKPMFGYSDVTCILNAIYSKTGGQMYLYQVRNLMYGDEILQQDNFLQTFIFGKDHLLTYPVEWVQGNHMEGIVCGGNIRCLLKLAGTEYFPDLENKILVLESNSGTPEAIVSMFQQLKMMGVFQKVSGIILGTFTQMEQEQYCPDVVQLLLRVIGESTIPIAKTSWIGHGIDSKAVPIGSKLIVDHYVHMENGKSCI